MSGRLRDIETGFSISRNLSMVIRAVCALLSFYQVHDITDITYKVHIGFSELLLTLQHVRIKPEPQRLPCICKLGNPLPFEAIILCMQSPGGPRNDTWM